MSLPGLVGIGVDAVDVARFRDILARRPGFAARYFSESEQADCTSSADPAASLAARFAAKEAAVKALRPHGARPEWRSIEVRRMDGGWCELRLTGLAADLAAEAGISELSLSITHEPMVAAACVVGVSRSDLPARSRTSSPERKGL